MKLLITGASGMLGTDVQTAARAADVEVVALTRADLDISDRHAVTTAIAAVSPDAVINCAAYTNVDRAESDPDGAAAVNTAGAGFVAEATAKVGAWVLHVSTDYVFDGTKTAPYVESDPTGPRSVYGSTKLLGERSVALGAPDRHTIVRSSWLFGNAGPCFPATMLKLAGEYESLNVVDDQVGCPTFTRHLAEALVALVAGTRIPGVVHVAAAGECSWFDFAVEILRASGASAEVRPCSTNEFPRPARRPAYSVLRSERAGVPALPDWHAGLDAYLNARVTA
jgi:dTDP-4-dehydrorhamnose reductase